MSNLPDPRQPMADDGHEAEYLQLQKIDMNYTSNLLEAEDYVMRNRDELVQNLKIEIVKPLQDIKYYKIFSLMDAESETIKINNEIICQLCFQVLEDFRSKNELEERDGYIHHLWKLILAIPAIFQGKILTGSNVSKSFSKSSSTGSRSKATNQISDLKYTSTPIPKEELDQEVSKMERYFCEKMRTMKIGDIYHLLHSLFSIFSYRYRSISFNSQELEFKSKVEHFIIDPILMLFQFVLSEEFWCRSLPTPVQVIIGIRGHVYPDITLTKGDHTEPLAVIEVKRPSLIANYLSKQNDYITDDIHETRLTNQLVIYMLSTHQKFGILTDLSGMTLYELPLGAACEMYDENENILFLRHTTIKATLLDSEGPDQTLYNYLEARTCIALVMYRNMFDKELQTEQSSEKVKQIYQMIRNRQRPGRESMLGQSLNLDTHVEREDNLPAVQEEGEEEEEEEEDSEVEIELMSDTNESSNTSSLDSELFEYLKPTLTKINLSEQWYTVVRSSCEGHYLSDIFEIDKSTFVELFEPIEAELRLLSHCQGSKLVMKCFTDLAAFGYFYQNTRDIMQAHPDIKNPKDYFMTVVLRHFSRETEANIEIMKHNLLVRERYPSRMINSPIMVKFGGVVNHENDIYGFYIIFEEVNKADGMNREKINNLSDVHKKSIKNEILKLHRFAKISHGDIASRNLFFDDEKGIPRFIDFENSRKLTTTTDSDLLINDDWEMCDEMLS